MLVIFVAFKVWGMALFNVFSVALFTTTLLFSKRGWLNTSLLLGGLEVTAHQALAVLGLGLEPAFQNYILILAVGTLFYRHIPLHIRVGMAILPVLGYIRIYLHALHNPPWFPMDPAGRDLMAVVNISFFVIILMSICIYFQFSVEKARIQAEKMAESKTRFLANMSHELRTPLNAILGFAQILRRSEALNPKERDNLATINRSGEHLLELINDILDMSKMEAGKLELQTAPLDLHRLIRDLEGMFALVAQEKQIELHMELGDDLPQFFIGDELRLRQVLINLLSNALKFTQRGETRLRVSAAQSGLAKSGLDVTFEVRDTGSGIAREELRDLFQLFAQTESGRRSRKGTGLGLALSQRFVQLMGGRITVESELGKGTTFRFTLPMHRVAAAGRPAAGGDDECLQVEPSGRGLQMLVVDDNADNRDVLTQSLGGMGFETQTASDGALAVECWKQERQPIIWMDLRMPVMNGYEACRAIREWANAQGFAKPAIVAITASSLHRSSAHEFDAQIGKPFREGDLRKIITRLLGVTFTRPSAAAAEQNQRAEGAASPDTAAMARRLAAVDTAVRSELSRAALLADFDAVTLQIQRIATTDAELAAWLERWALQYRFDFIESLLNSEESQTPAPL